jgi:hypothetical protein
MYVIADRDRSGSDHRAGDHHDRDHFGQKGGARSLQIIVQNSDS